MFVLIVLWIIVLRVLDSLGFTYEKLLGREHTYHTGRAAIIYKDRDKDKRSTATIDNNNNSINAGPTR